MNHCLKNNIINYHIQIKLLNPKIMKSKAIIAAMSAAILLAGAAVFAVKTSTSSLFRANVEALADVDPEVTTIPCVRAVSRCEFPAKDEDGFEFTMLVTGFRLKADE